MDLTTSSTLLRRDSESNPPQVRDFTVSHLGLMRLATVMMSLRLAGALTFAPEPIVMATSFSVRVWQICARGGIKELEACGITAGSYRLTVLLI